MNVWSKHIVENRGAYGGTMLTCRGIVFADGLKLSVQASEGHYCSPRENTPADGWKRFEVLPIAGTLTEADLEDLYADRKGEWTEHGWPAGWVSAEALDRVAERHGGLKK